MKFEGPRKSLNFNIKR